MYLYDYSNNNDNSNNDNKHCRLSELCRRRSGMFAEVARLVPPGSARCWHLSVRCSGVLSEVGVVAIIATQARACQCAPLRASGIYIMPCHAMPCYAIYVMMRIPCCLRRAPYPPRAQVTDDMKTKNQKIESKVHNK